MMLPLGATANAKCNASRPKLLLDVFEARFIVWKVAKQVGARVRLRSISRLSRWRRNISVGFTLQLRHKNRHERSRFLSRPLADFVRRSYYRSVRFGNAALASEKSCLRRGGNELAADSAFRHSTERTDKCV
jgi:hypothetical protein